MGDGGWGMGDGIIEKGRGLMVMCGDAIVYFQLCRPMLIPSLPSSFSPVNDHIK